MTDNVLHKDGKDYKYKQVQTQNKEERDYKHERQRHRTGIAKTINAKGKDTALGLQRL